jgi:polyketide cyclase/dehydrase/lipid transport protein
MKDVVEVEIAAPVELVAERYSNPRNSAEWMTDLERYEPISGEQGDVGSRYRLLTTKHMDFVATVVARDLPDSVSLVLDSDEVGVSITTTFVALPSGRTRLVSAEDFKFKGLAARVVGLFARTGIHRAHREQMDAFKRYVEGTQLA